MSGDCGTSQGITKESSFVKIFSKPFVKFAVEELIEIWSDKEKTINQTFQDNQFVQRSSQGDTDPKRLKLSDEKNRVGQQKQEWAWLQGYAINVSEDCDTFQISDSQDPKSTLADPIGLASSVLIVNCRAAPGGISLSTKGNYCQGEWLEGSNFGPIYTRRVWIGSAKSDPL